MTQYPAARAFGWLAELYDWPVLLLAYGVEVAAVACVSELKGLGQIWEPIAIILPILFFVLGYAVLAAFTRTAGSFDVPRSGHALGAVAVALTLGVVGLTARYGLGQRGPGLWTQPLHVGLATLLFFATIAVVVGYRHHPRWQWSLGIAVGALGALAYGNRPRASTPLPGAALRIDFPEPLIDVALIGAVAAGIAWIDRTRRIDGRLRDLAPSPLCLAPLAALMVIAFTRDGAAVALLAGAIGAWVAAVRGRGTAQVAGGVAAMLALFFAALELLMLIGSGGSFSYSAFTWSGVFFGTAAGSGRPAAVQVGSWLGRDLDHRGLTPGATLAQLGRPTALAAAVAVTALAVLLIAALHATARLIRGTTAASWANGLVWFIAAQGLLPVLALLGLPSAGLTPPLVSDAVAWCVADVLAIGIVIGLAWRVRPAGETDGESFGACDKGGSADDGDHLS
jgi:hypothetical protein